MIFSVVIPCYNCVKTLEATVNSIRACGLTDYEILLVDDGSSDGTAKLCDTLCVRYPELRCVHQKNAGVSAARNRGINEARGGYRSSAASDVYKRQIQWMPEHCLARRIRLPGSNRICCYLV